MKFSGQPFVPAGSFDHDEIGFRSDKTNVGVHGIRRILSLLPPRRTFSGGLISSVAWSLGKLSTNGKISPPK